MADHTDAARPRWPGDGKDFRVTMGLHPCADDAWLWRESDAQQLINAKAATLAAHHEDAVAITPAGEGAAREAADLLRLTLLQRGAADSSGAAHTDGLEGTANDAPDSSSEQFSSADEVELGERVARADAAVAAGMHPLEAFAREVAEDICILTPVEDTDEAPTQGDVSQVHRPAESETRYVLSAAVLCAPSRWSLREKLGMDISSIHEPVPGYENIAAPTARFFQRLRVGDIIERTNWTVLDSPVLFQPDRAQATHAFTSAGAENAKVTLNLFWLRLERQTLRKLPHSGAVVFTILTTNTRLDELVIQQPSVALQLAHAMRTAPTQTWDYKGWHRSAPHIARALEEACSAA